MRAQRVPEPSPAEMLNPEAGDHAVPSDPIEIAAAREASERSLCEFPYYERRYGERGRRFGDSDSAWLITLSAMQRTAAFRQILWLGSVLASRGMPRYLLEAHLRFLYDALVAALPKRKRAYALLRDGANVLARARARRIDDETFRELSLRFAGREIEHFGELLVSAVADEADGLSLAVSSIESWACDEKMFAPEWIAAVRATIDAARERVRDHAGR